MTFRRLSPNTFPAKTLEVAQQRSRSLYREWLREIPRSIIKYPLDISVSMGRLRVRTEWERYRNVTNLDVLNVLLVKGTQELIETHNKWKQRVHVMRFFDNPKWDQLAQTALQPTPGVGLLQEEAKSPFIREFLRK